MKNSLKLLTACLSIMATAGVPTTLPVADPAVIHERSNLPTIQHIEVNGDYIIQVEEGPYEIHYSGTKPAIDALGIRVSKNTLHISANKPKAGWFSRLFNFRASDEHHLNASIIISAPKLSTISLRNNSQMVVKNDLNLNNILLSGSSLLQLMASQNSRQLTIDLTGDSRLEATDASAQNTAIDINDNAKAFFLSLEAKKLKLSLSGNTQAHIQNISAQTTQITSSGQSVNNLDYVDSEQIAFHITDNSEQNLRTLKTRSLSFNQSDESKLNILLGQSAYTNGTVSANATYQFNQFNPGNLDLH